MPKRSVRILPLLPSVLLAVTVVTLVDCGGSGHHSNSSSGNTSTAKPSITIDWPARSKDLAAPASALSCLIAVTDSNSQTVTIRADRGNNPAAFVQTYQATSAVKTGTCQISVQFYANAGETSMVVGSGGGEATMDASGGGLSTFAISSNVSSVTVSAQSVAVGATQQLTYTAKDAAGNILALQPGSDTWTNSGSAATVTASGLATGVSPGSDTVTVRVDQVTSAPATLTVTGGQASGRNCGDPMSQGTVECTAGVATHLESYYEDLTPEAVDDMSDMGAAYMRFDMRNSVASSNYNTDNAAYDFSPYTPFINKAISNGMKCVAVLGYGYASPANSTTTFVAPLQDPFKTRWDKYVKASVTNYRAESSQHKIIWEVWNEPENDVFVQWNATTEEERADAYMAVLKDTATQIHSVDPQAIIAAPVIALDFAGNNGGTPAFLQRCKDDGLLQIPNIMIDVHPGAGTDNSGYIDIDPEKRWGYDPTNSDGTSETLTLKTLRDMIGSTPLFISEWSFNCATGANNQSAQMIRSFLCGMDAGATGIAFYQYKEYVGIDSGYERDHGLIDRNGNRTPNYMAYQSFVNSLKGYRVSGRIVTQDGGGHYTLKFVNSDGRTATAYWSQYNATTTYPSMPKIVFESARSKVRK